MSCVPCLLSSLGVHDGCCGDLALSVLSVARACAATAAGTGPAQCPPAGVPHSPVCTPVVFCAVLISHIVYHNCST